MISLTTVQLNAWIAAFFFPLARILALLAAAPPFSNPGLTTRVRLILGLAMAVAVTPALPTMPGVEPASGIGLLNADWIQILSVAGMAAVVSLLTSIGTGAVMDGSPSVGSVETVAEWPRYEPERVDYDESDGADPGEGI